MLIALHTKHIMGAPSVKAGLPLWPGFIESSEKKEGPEKSLQGSGLRGDLEASWSPGRTPPPALGPGESLPASRGALGGFPSAAGSLKE